MGDERVQNVAEIIRASGHGTEGNSPVEDNYFKKEVLLPENLAARPVELTRKLLERVGLPLLEKIDSRDDRLKKKRERVESGEEIQGLGLEFRNEWTQPQDSTRFDIEVGVQRILVEQCYENECAVRGNRDNARRVVSANEGIGLERLREGSEDYYRLSEAAADKLRQLPDNLPSEPMLLARRLSEFGDSVGQLGGLLASKEEVRLGMLGLMGMTQRRIEAGANPAIGWDELQEKLRQGFYDEVESLKIEVPGRDRGEIEDSRVNDLVLEIRETMLKQYGVDMPGGVSEGNIWSNLNLEYRSDNKGGGVWVAEEGGLAAGYLHERKYVNDMIASMRSTVEVDSTDPDKGLAGFAKLLLARSGAVELATDKLEIKTKIMKEMLAVHDGMIDTLGNRNEDQSGMEVERRVLERLESALINVRKVIEREDGEVLVNQIGINDLYRKHVKR